MKTLIYSILSILLITSCTTYSESDLKRFDKEIKSYIKKTNLNYQSPIQDSIIK